MECTPFIKAFKLMIPLLLQKREEQTMNKRNEMSSCGKLMTALQNFMERL